MSAEGTCPECGARLGDAETCEALFHAALAMEWVDPPKTAEAHHLLVSTYMLQHPSRFTPEGRALFAETVKQTVDEELSAPELRSRYRGRFDQQVRTWKLKAEQEAPPVLRQWSRTIADVVDGPPEGLPERVWRWSRSVRKELDEHRG